MNSRIRFILDTYDYMVNGSYQAKPVTAKGALEFIAGKSGKYFDPEIVEAFISIADNKRSK